LRGQGLGVRVEGSGFRGWGSSGMEFAVRDDRRGQPVSSALSFGEMPCFDVRVHGKTHGCDWLKFRIFVRAQFYISRLLCGSEMGS
jgi:hypothetical protein